MENQAVITADIVASRKIKPKQLEETLRDIAKGIEKVLFRRKKTFEFYRGDSFQAIVPPELSLRVALIWKAAIQSVQENGKTWDIRIAIGIGNIAHKGAKVTTSSGKAFEYSGLLLDELKTKETPKLGIRTFDEKWNAQLETECILADIILQRWTAIGAESIYYALLYQETQEQLAARFGITQSAVHKRLSAANWSAIRHWEQYFSQQALSFSKTK
ncbi:MAG TPA: SatD family protein [Flavipsychrobacter sp.]|nr:SatD family protein [Flavipsychrobacter sp.]